MGPPSSRQGGRRYGAGPGLGGRQGGVWWHGHSLRQQRCVVLSGKMHVESMETSLVTLWRRQFSMMLSLMRVFSR